MSIRQEAYVGAYIDWHSAVKALDYIVDNREIERFTVQDVEKLLGIASSLLQKLKIDAAATKLASSAVEHKYYCDRPATKESAEPTLLEVVGDDVLRLKNLNYNEQLALGMCGEVIKDGVKYRLRA